MRAHISSLAHRPESPPPPAAAGSSMEPQLDPESQGLPLLCKVGAFCKILLKFRSPSDEQSFTDTQYDLTDGLFRTIVIATCVRLAAQTYAPASPRPSRQHRLQSLPRP